MTKMINMTIKRSVVSLLGGLVLAGSASATALAADKTYQVTGPVLEVSDTSITVEKGKEKWQLARTKDTKVTGELKVGAKVTIAYTMTAVTIEAKGDAKAAKAAAAKEAPAPGVGAVTGPATGTDAKPAPGAAKPAK